MNGSITGVHHKFVKSALPYWYVSATAEQRLSLHRDILAGRLLQVEKVNVLSGLKGLREFAKGKLAQALDAHDMFGTGFDVEHDEIWIAQLETRGASSGPAGVSGGRAEVVTGYRKTTLLQAALHNYRNDEVEAVRQERYSRLQRVASSVVRPASAARFMAFCRALDVGGQYQSHLHAVLNPTAQALAGGAPGADEIRQAIDRCARNALHIEAHIAYMQGPLKADDYHAVLSACAYDDGRPPQTAAAVWSLSMLGFNLADVLVFTPPVTGGYIVYIPGEPHSVFRKHSSLDELTAWLRLMLGYERYQRLFADFVDKGKQRQFLTRLNRHLKPEVPTPYRGKPDLDLDLRLHPIVNLATDHFSRKALAAIRSEARALAVPTEDRDQAEVRGLMREWLDLDATLGGWVDPVGPAEALSAQRRGVREQVSAALISAWRADSAALSMMPGPRALTLRNVDMAELAELPDLPEPYARISRIHLDAVTASAEQLDGFVRRFANVVELSINNVLFTRLPGQLAALERLSRLTLTGVRGMAIDQDVMDQLMQLSGLTALDLSENVFGEISRFEHPALRDLMLRNAQLTQWPQWVDDLSLSSLDISANEIEHLPRRIIENEGQASPPMVIHAYGNPLDQEELSQFWDSNQGRSGGRYRVEADSVSALNWEDSSEAGSEVWSDWDWEVEHGAGPSSLPVEPDVAIWRVDEPGREAMNARLHADWQTLDQAADAPNLLKLIQRLKETPDFKNSHASLAMDVRDVLEAAAHDPALRERLNAMAYDRLSGTGQTCQDGVRLIFSDIRIAVLESAALRDEPHFRHGEALLRMVRSLFRLSEVESIAAEDIALRSGQVDAAEVRMAYRIGLAEELQLPGQPSSMQWERVAAVSPQAIDNARFEVLTREQGTALIEYAASNSRWVEFLRQFCADDFARLRALYDEQMEALEADAEEFDRQSEALMNRYQVSERLLLEQLTQNLVDEYF